MRMQAVVLALGLRGAFRVEVVQEDKWTQQFSQIRRAHQPSDRAAAVTSGTVNDATRSRLGGGGRGEGFAHQFHCAISEYATSRLVGREAKGYVLA